MAEAGPTMGELAASFREWIAAHGHDFEANRRRGPGSTDAAKARDEPFHRALHQAGWTRWGWPVDAGGLGGSPLLRAVFHEELAIAGFVMPESLMALEVIAPTIVRYAPEIARAHLPAFLRGDEEWCQGFSEPDAGSDLAALRTRAVDDGDAYRVNGQKIWTSAGHLARWCVMLARTGTPESRHRGITFFWLDLHSPGVTIRPIACASGREELSELFFDDVVVPKANVVGEQDGGWEPLMYLMQFERGGFAWGRQAWLHARLDEGLRAAGPHVSGATASAVGEAWLTLTALRERVWRTVVRLAAGESPGPEISIDKLLLSGAEQAVYDASRLLRGNGLELGDDDSSAAFRQEWFFSRLVSVYGGAAEVQRDIVAQRILSLPRSR
jgi:alkylation response protein AidB-like acyl-CoA dehydrogenase